ncbi:hypothetical protein EHEL_011100 [Encephalitozoon hellem ATCC 50504]|uniref:SAS N-terminal domain-containing protein n=1 Tax=Encephalitozoon hellem TaxID=27973 RepID=A0A9Q9C6Q6_ENCHE|nr:uncharacterized protein EHEL_011100 [Encephalitozoon hellem ATCC 50504]AFM97733.1 hypothetical protein EHEL_011100 [Encephalitozoon hellem ATCC 50504]UTX42425.1 SAS N-terminal domain-containing protein [Encephalitozoon hellem]WEL37868.1 SAS N-terminal domain-containing protein [Encephalitozoon hellem]|eukprot:XP_003886714.1 hypothetical protein EHEL_011100 [Encephalitozoon hellem ATCC 50504]
MRESIFTGKIPISCQNEEIPWQMKCDIVRSDDEVEIRLIDTRDIFTFYFSTISPGDFYVMKREQDIIVDYEKFVSILVKMFHSLHSGKLRGLFSKETSKFLFVEKDEFRNIVRLELKFSKPDETHYKMYLGDMIGRMESENVRLVKENGMLRDKCRSGEKELRDRIRYLEEEAMAAQKKMNKLYKENELLNEKGDAQREEVERLNSKTYDLEKENGRLQYELDKLKLQDVKNSGLVERAQKIEDENKTLKEELNTANEIIRKYSEEIAQMKSTISGSEDATKDLRQSNKKYKSEIEDLKKRMKGMEDKMKKMKEELKSKETRLKDLETENMGLVKNLENAQNVYSHFYSKNIENPTSINYSDNESVFSIAPESSPH